LRARPLQIPESTKRAKDLEGASTSLEEEVAAQKVLLKQSEAVANLLKTVSAWLTTPVVAGGR